jgi:hypothetical protein
MSDNDGCIRDVPVCDRDSEVAVHDVQGFNHYRTLSDTELALQPYSQHWGSDMSVCVVLACPSVA